MLKYYTLVCYHSGPTISAPGEIKKGIRTTVPCEILQNIQGAGLWALRKDCVEETSNMKDKIKTNKQTIIILMKQT